MSNYILLLLFGQKHHLPEFRWLNSRCGVLWCPRCRLKPDYCRAVRCRKGKLLSCRLCTVFLALAENPERAGQSSRGCHNLAVLGYPSIHRCSSIRAGFTLKNKINMQTISRISFVGFKLSVPCLPVSGDALNVLRKKLFAYNLFCRCFKSIRLEF